MDEAEREVETAAAAPTSVWARLKAAREAAGFSMPELASRTRVTQRYLEALEEGRPNDLPSPTYATGFAKAYARAVGLNEVDVGRDVRDEIARVGAPVRQYNIQEVADPARGPSRGLVIFTAGLALAVLVLAVLWLATGLFRGTGEVAPAPLPTEAVATTSITPAAVPQPGGGPVVLTATDAIWLRIYDGVGSASTRLFEGTMKPGDHFEVPATATDPMINVGRPDKLSITVGGQPVAPLGDGKRALKDVPIGAAALLARGKPTSTASPSPASTTAATSATTPSAAATGRSRTAPSPRATRSAVPRAFASPTPQASSTPVTGTVVPAAKAASVPNPAPAPTATTGN